MFEEKSFAKLNLTLEITGKEGEFHTIESIFQKISLHDLVKIRISNEHSVNFSHSIRNKVSTVDLAITLFKEKTGIHDNYEVFIEKNIPMGSGLGGGSSNAATTLLLLNKMYKNPLSKEDLIEIGTKIGKDVPFFINGSTAFVSHFGESVERLKPLKEMHFVLVHPTFHHKTKEMYSLFDEFGKFSSGEKSRALRDLIENGNYTQRDLEKLFYNDFEVMLLEKSENFSEFKGIVEKITGISFHLTGSGSTIFAIFEEENEAVKTKRMLDKFKFRTNIAKSIANS